MYIIMLGAPGSGKGTIGKSLCKEFNLKHLSTGDVFREEISKQTELGKEASLYMAKGELVPDEVTIAMVEGYLDKFNDVLLDGFPRTINQAEALKDYLNIRGKELTAVIDLQVPDEDIVKRTSSRVTCSNKTCGSSFNTIFMPPKVNGICDVCGSKLITRADDEPEMIKDRLFIYHKETEPLIDYYKKQNKLDKIDIDIYSKTTRDDTTSLAIKDIRKRLQEGK